MFPQYSVTCGGKFSVRFSANRIVYNMERYHLLLAVFAAFAVFGTCDAMEVDTYDLLMPGVTPNKDELYLCTPIRINSKTSYYIVGFEPKASMKTAHHILIYGCTAPGSNDTVWNCGEMQNNEKGNQWRAGSPCSEGSQIIYAWARDAPPLHLPEDVGFLVGAGSPIKYMVLQVHYMHRFPETVVDTSGVYLKYTKERQYRQAGVYLLGTGGMIPAHHVEHMETACTISENKVMHPFAFRTHTHGLGKVVSAYVVRQSEQGDFWKLLGSRDPQDPQMFYPVANTDPIQRGDVLAARCTMDNDRDHDVVIGSTNKDEMCNFYLMYYVENDTPLERKYCFSAGPPYYYWNRAPEHFNRIPDYEASHLDNENRRQRHE